MNNNFLDFNIQLFATETYPSITTSYSYTYNAYGYKKETEVVFDAQGMTMTNVSSIICIRDNKDGDIINRDDTSLWEVSEISVDLGEGDCFRYKKSFNKSFYQELKITLANDKFFSITIFDEGGYPPESSLYGAYLNPDFQIGDSGMKLSELIKEVVTLKNSTTNPYPIGAIYMSVDSTSPDTLFGGTWTRLKDKFLLGAGDSFTAGNTGGHKSLQAHTHSIPSLSGTAASAGAHTHVVTTKTTSYAAGSQPEWRCMSFADTNADYTQTVNSGSDGGHTHSVTTTSSTTGSTGSGLASSNSEGNMPPYLVVYMWKRVS